MNDKIEDIFENQIPDGVPEWKFYGFASEEEFAIAKKEKADAEEKEEAEYQAKLLKESHEDEDAARRAIEDGTYYNEEEQQRQYLEAQKEDQRKVEQEYKEFEQKKEITFDDVVDKFAPVLIGLKGNSYKPATKMVFYSVLANQIKKNFFTVDSKKIDLRIPLLIMMKAGHGKKSYEAFIKKTIQGLEKEYSEPTSFHPEQFIGRVDKVDDFYTQTLGFFASDYLMIDEAYELLSSEKDEFKETLKYIRTALDPIGSNEIEKKQVTINYENRLHYCPECTISLLTQPISEINENLLTRGSFRRFVILMVETSIDERLQARREAEFFTQRDDADVKVWNHWIKNNKKLTELKLVFNSKKEDLILIDDYIDKIIIDLKLDNSQEALEFANSIQYNMKFLILKMAIVRATIEQMTDICEIKRRHIEKAIEDFNMTWIPQVNWIRRKMVIVSDKPREWKEIHTWIYDNLMLTQRFQSDVVNKWAEKNEGQFKEATLKEYAKRAIKDLKKWGYILEIPSGDRNTKMLKVKHYEKK